MKTIVVYTSQTGFTKKYAEWISQEMNADIMTLGDAKKKEISFFNIYDVIIYGGWAIAGKIKNADWLIGNISNWKDKELVLFCVGASPNENPDVDVALHNALTDEQRNYVKTFYCQGGLDYDKMVLPSKLAMKAFAAMLSKKKDMSPNEVKMAEMMSKSYDISDRKYVEPIVEYLAVTNDMKISKRKLNEN